MGREFDQLFDEWASTYDETVEGRDPEYREVFLHYDEILDEVAEKSNGTVLEFGVGTGNLTSRLLDRNHLVYGVEPSKEMRAIAKKKLPHVDISDGDFLSFKEMEESIHSIVSTYAFHHLVDDEKERAISNYSKLLQSEGKIVFADTIFVNEMAKRDIISKAERMGYVRLVNDLRTEYYTTIPFFQETLNKYGFNVTFKQMNPYVWIFEAIKR